MTSIEQNVGYDARNGVVTADFFDRDVALISLMERKHLTLKFTFSPVLSIVTCKLKPK
jgi:hypothetical protein